VSGFPIGLVLFLLLCVLVIASGADYTIRRIWAFQRRRFKKGNLRSQLRPGFEVEEKSVYQVDLRDIRDFMVNLQLGTSMDRTLSGALAETAKQFQHKGIFGERLRRQVDAKLSTSPEAVIEGLAEDFQSVHLRELLERLSMAREGGVSYERALAISVSAIEEDIRGQVELEIQQAPLKLTIPMVVGIFVPALVLGIIPLLTNVLEVFKSR